jgi:hypothetical protein
LFWCLYWYSFPSNSSPTPPMKILCFWEKYFDIGMVNYTSVSQPKWGQDPHLSKTDSWRIKFLNSFNGFVGFSRNWRIFGVVEESYERASRVVCGLRAAVWPSLYYAFIGQFSIALCVVET